MSLPRLVRNSPDLTQLVNEGYSVRIHAGHLIIDDIPFVTAARTIIRGSLVCPLDTEGERTRAPSTHVMWFSHLPHTKDGVERSDLIHDRTRRDLADGIEVAGSSSQKVRGGDYPNFYEKVVAYAALVSGDAQAIDSTAVPATFKPVVSDETESVFKYLDTNSSRAGITALSEKLALQRVAIVGLGGTGSYLLDLLVKVQIRELHLYDGDTFSTHNSFRSPGAATVDELNAAPYKVAHHAARYEPLRWGICPHPTYVTTDNVSELLEMDFVFLSMDATEDKKVIIDTLTASDIPFIDTGIGVRQDSDGLAGLLRVTTSLPGHRDHLNDDQLISYRLGDAAEYETNIQVAELNALVASLAVIAFKKRYDFYSDTESELHSLYRIDSNEIINKYGEGSDE
ncbi:ThiF family adenylyltransferase [Kribbella speibonae]|uniref:ThiF family adenylyltransferase n=1 Tax=Kribbella speibonae TaxID=1572660 RepID=A0ABY2A4N2_9ACTN|nr:ThiF family adenylyltransferase [Kribbella speibonae]TCC21916.1 ThiF family adenylyltransferase [Kribbella speibonae]